MRKELKVVGILVCALGWWRHVGWWHVTVWPPPPAPYVAYDVAEHPTPHPTNCTRPPDPTPMLIMLLT